MYWGTYICGAIRIKHTCIHMYSGALVQTFFALLLSVQLDITQHLKLRNIEQVYTYEKRVGMCVHIYRKDCAMVRCRALVNIKKKLARVICEILRVVWGIMKKGK